MASRKWLLARQFNSQHWSGSFSLVASFIIIAYSWGFVLLLESSIQLFKKRELDFILKRKEVRYDMENEH